jgi:hypothetical protein
MVSVVYSQKKARGALLMRDAQLRIKRNLDCSGLLITSPTTLAVWKLGDSVPDDLLLMTVSTTHATARLSDRRAGRYKLQITKGGHLVAFYKHYASRSTTRHP